MTSMDKNSTGHVLDYVLVSPFGVCVMWTIKADFVENPKEGYSPGAWRHASTIYKRNSHSFLKLLMNPISYYW